MRALGEEVAWRLLRALAAEGVEGEGSSRVRLSLSGEAVPPAGEDGEDGEVPEASPGTAWLEVRSSGEWETAPPPDDGARDLIELFLPLLLPSTVVVAQLAQSLDGRIATESGHSQYVSGPDDIRRLHRLRALVDAVIVGAETVLADDPRLTVRKVPGENPVRVVLDPDGRLTPAHRIFSDASVRTLVIRREAGRGGEEPTGREEPTRGEGGASGVQTLVLPHAPPRGFEPASVVRALRERGMRRILVEGGGVTVSRFLEAGALDRLHITVAPLLIGSGRPALTLPPVDTLEQALRPPCRHFRLGADVLFDLDLRGS